VLELLNSGKIKKSEEIIKETLGKNRTEKFMAEIIKYFKEKKNSPL
jgi:hypothetical protein